MMRYLFAYLFLTFPQQFSKNTHVNVTRCLGKARQNMTKESSLETNDSPKPVIFNENDTEKMERHSDIFMEF